MKTTFGSEPPTGEPPLRGYWSSQNLRFEARVAFDIFEAGGVQLEDFQPNFKLGAENL